MELGEQIRLYVYSFMLLGQGSAKPHVYCLKDNGRSRRGGAFETFTDIRLTHTTSVNHI